MSSNKKFDHCYFSILYLLSIITFYNPIQLFGQTNLILPTSDNIYQDSYILPNGNIRLVGNEHATYKGLFFVDKFIDGQITDPVFFPGAQEGADYNLAGIHCDIIPLKGGEAILGINQFECDYPLPPGICLIDIQGKVLWGRYLEEYAFDYDIEKMILVDTQVFCVLNSMDTLYFDFQGNVMSKELHYIIYDQVVNSNEGYLTSLESQVYLLDDSFNKLDSIQLDSTILHIFPIADTAILVSTIHSVFLLKSDLSLIAETNSFPNVGLATVSNGSICLGQINGQSLYETNELLQPVDTFLVHEDIKIKTLVTSSENIVAMGDYYGPLGAAMFLHSSNADSFSFEVINDISIDTVTLDDNVFYSIEPFSFDGINTHYKNIVVGITNNGFDTIQTITIQYSESTGCGMCDGIRYQWTFHTLNLLPGMKTELFIGDFSIWCAQIDPEKLCLWAAPADNIPEMDRANNRYCADVNAILVGLEDQTLSDIVIYPNPASYSIHISREKQDLNSQPNYLRILNFEGKAMFDSELYEDVNELDISYLPTGVYSAIITLGSGKVMMQKLVIMR